MWSCKHCRVEFDFNKSERANHSRWCSHNPKRNEWNRAKGTITQYGHLVEYTMICECCGSDFVVEEREKLHPQRDKYFCSRSCANNRQAWWNDNASYYRTIAFQHWKKECAICCFDKIVTVHHIDEDHSNNDPQNLIPLCPNHHEMFHSPWRAEVEPLIFEAVEKKWADSAKGNTSALHAEIRGSNPRRSTKIAALVY